MQDGKHKPTPIYSFHLLKNNTVMETTEINKAQLKQLL